MIMDTGRWDILTAFAISAKCLFRIKRGRKGKPWRKRFILIYRKERSR